MDSCSGTDCSGTDTTCDNPNRHSSAVKDSGKDEEVESEDQGMCLVAAERLREEGNTKFRAKNFTGAEQDYQEAVRLLQQSKLAVSRSASSTDKAREKACRAPVLLNLALCCLKQQPCEAFQALEYCDEVLLLEPGHPKATYRRAKALVELGELAEGQRELVRACKLVPKDMTSRRELEHVRHRMRELADKRGQARRAGDMIDDFWNLKQASSENASSSSRRLGFLLGSCKLVQSLEASGHATSEALDALSALAEQAIWMGIDYRSLGLGWNHPTTRLEYWRGQHPSTTHKASRRRAAKSRKQLVQAVKEVVSGSREMEAVIVEAFLREVGLADGARHGECAKAATYSAVCTALQAELMLPLRSFNEGEEFMLETYRGNRVPQEAIAECLQALMLAVLSRPDGFSAWRYTCPAGLEQLRGLSSDQKELWQKPLKIDHDDDVSTHEDSENEHGFFWAGKIGGPSHGFDFEAQCCLPLLANARHKVVLTSVAWWPAYPVARAHFRLLWTAPGASKRKEQGDDDEGNTLEGSNVSIQSEPRLWLEAVNIEFAAEDQDVVDKRLCIWATLNHAAAKSEAMRAPLSLSPSLLQAMRTVVEDRETGGSVMKVKEQLVLRPSNGVCEASDYLSSEHDWVQMSEEVTDPIARVLYVPAG